MNYLVKMLFMDTVEETPIPFTRPVRLANERVVAANINKVKSGKPVFIFIPKALLSKVKNNNKLNSQQSRSYLIAIALGLEVVPPYWSKGNKRELALLGAFAQYDEPLVTHIVYALWDGEIYSFLFRIQENFVHTRQGKVTKMKKNVGRLVGIVGMKQMSKFVSSWQSKLHEKIQGIPGLTQAGLQT